MLENKLLEVVVRSLISVVFLVFCARIIGARQISQLTFYDYVSGITIGSIAGTLCIDTDIPFYYSVLAIAIFSLASIIMAMSTNKSIILRRIFTGTAKILIDDGKFIEGNMRHANFDIDDVLRELRSQGYFSVSEVKYAILETNGKMSLLPYAKNKPVTTQDMNLTVNDGCVEANVIIDGKVMEQNLSYAGKDSTWLHEKMSEMNLEIKDVLLGTLDDKDNLACYIKGQTTLLNTSFQ